MLDAKHQPPHQLPPLYCASDETALIEDLNHLIKQAARLIQNDLTKLNTPSNFNSKSARILLAYAHYILYELHRLDITLEESDIRDEQTKLYHNHSSAFVIEINAGVELFKCLTNDSASLHKTIDSASLHKTIKDNSDYLEYQYILNAKQLQSQRYQILEDENTKRLLIQNVKAFHNILSQTNDQQSFAQIDQALVPIDPQVRELQSKIKEFYDSTNLYVVALKIKSTHDVAPQKSKLERTLKETSKEIFKNHTLLTSALKTKPKLSIELMQSCDVLLKSKQKRSDVKQFGFENNPHYKLLRAKYETQYLIKKKFGFFNSSKNNRLLRTKLTATKNAVSSRGLDVILTDIMKDYKPKTSIYSIANYFRKLIRGKEFTHKDTKTYQAARKISENLQPRLA